MIIASKTLSVVFILFFVPHILPTSIHDKQDCEVSNTGKRPGHSYPIKQKRIWNQKPNQNYTETYSDICWTNCDTDFECQMADFDYRSYTCTIYYLFVEEYQIDYKHSTYIWHFCNLANGPLIKEGVRGFWFFKSNLKLHFKPIYTSKWPRCGELCLRNEICGGYNVRKSTYECEMLELWENPNSTEYVQDKDWWTYFWVPQQPFEYEIKYEMCRWIQERRCIGKWEVSKRRENTPLDIVVSYRTRDFVLCYKSCELYTTCEGVTFYPGTHKCELRSSVNGSCHVPKNTEDVWGINVNWTCCYDRGESIDLAKESIQLNTRVCRRIANPYFVALIPLRCTSVSLYTSESCETKYKTETYNCFRNQAFMSSEKMFGEVFLKVSNGYQTFLVKNATNENVPTTPLDHCQLYNASIPKTPDVTITLFSEWYPIRSYNDNIALSVPVKYVIVGVLPHDGCLCYVWLHCVEILRRIQRKENIPFQFIIANKGDIFENRGWLNQSRTFHRNYPYDLIYIGFLGDFSINNATIESMNAFRNMVAFGVDRGYIDRHYTLMTDFDFKIKGSRDYRSIYNVIRTLPRYNGLVRAECRNEILRIVTMNMAGFVVLTILVLFISNLVYKFIHSNVCNFFRRKVIQSQISSTEFFTSDLEIKTFLKFTFYFENIVNYNTGHIKENSTSFFWINEKGESSFCSKYRHKTQKLLWLYRTKEKSINLSYLVQDSERCHHENVCLIFRVDTIHYKSILVILHLEKQNRNNALRNIICFFLSGKCLCLKYNLYHLNTEPKNTNFTLLR